MPDNEIDAILQERKKYKPSLDHVRYKYARIMMTDGTMAQAISKQKEFDRALAAHDQALREQIADDLRIEALNEDPDIPDTYREGVRDGLMRGVDIARGEDQTDE